VIKIFVMLAVLFSSLHSHSQTDSVTVRKDSTVTVINSTGITGYVDYPDSLLTYSESGIASWYGQHWNGRLTSSGEVYSVDSMTAAHKRLPLGTVVKVTNTVNDSVIFVKITDRLPKSSKRSIDLTPTAAKKLNFYSDGLTKVKIEVTGYAPIYKKQKPVSKTAIAKKN
jgi:rare lipoprotein A (peptidoglycan hydrolase)